MDRVSLGISQLMNNSFQESNIYVNRGGHTSNVVMTKDGHLTSSCWDLVRLSQTDHESGFV